MKARWIGNQLTRGDLLPEPGDIGIGAENYHHNLMVNCPICHNLHVVDIIGYSTNPRPRWSWDQATFTLTPSVKVLTNHSLGDEPDSVCHWNLTNGEFIIHSDSTASPKIDTKDE